jgi:hypothetical protein
VKLAYDRGTIAGSCIVDKEPFIVPELGMERHAQNSLLPAACYFGSQVQEYRCRGRARLQYLDHAGLLDNEQPVRPIMRMGHVKRLGQAGQDWGQTQRGRCCPDLCGFGSMIGLRWL